MVATGLTTSYQGTLCQATRRCAQGRLSPGWLPPCHLLLVGVVLLWMPWRATSRQEGPDITMYKLLKSPQPAVPFGVGAKGNFNTTGGGMDPESQREFDTMVSAANSAHQRLSKVGARRLSRRQIIDVLEPIVPATFGGGKCGEGTCQAGWDDVKQRQAAVVYLPSLVDLSGFERKVYIDGGAREYDSSVGGWFLQSYPQAKEDNFDIFAFELDGATHGESYKGTPVRFMPYALWTTNKRMEIYGKDMKTLTAHSRKVSAAPKKKRAKMQTGHAKAIDFAQWMSRNTKPSDYVVVKLDIEGAEFEVLQHLVATNAIHLIDELFVECHYNKWSSIRMDKTRQHCVDLISNLRAAGVVAHEWF